MCNKSHSDSKSVLMKAYLLSWFLVLISFSATKLHAEDEYIEPQNIKITTPRYDSELKDFEPKTGVYSYTVSWQGIPAASVTTTVDKEDNKFKITANAKTYSGIDLFYKLRYRAEGLITAIGLNPLHTTIDHQENSRNKFVEINFLPSGEIETTRIDRKNDEITKLKFDPNNTMLDPFSAAFIARYQDWAIGETKEFDTYNGKSRYLIKLTAVDRVKVEFDQVERDAWVIVPTVQNLSYPKSEGKLKKAKIYVSDDKNRDILKIVSSVFVGSVTTELDSFRPYARPDDKSRVAAINSTFTK